MPRIGFRKKDGKYLVWYYRQQKKVWLYQGSNRARAVKVRDTFRGELKAFGMSALEFTPSDRVEMSEARLILHPFGASISDAVDFYAEHHRAHSSVSMNDAVEWFIGRCYDSDLRPVTVSGYKVLLGKFSVAFSGVNLGDISGNAVLEWIRELPMSNLSRQNYFRHIHAFYERVKNERPDWLTTNPIAGRIGQLPKVRRRSRIEFLTVEQTRRFLDAAPDEYKGMFAVLIFTGIRNEEGRRLPSECVNIRRRIIDIPEGLSKTDHPRLIEGVPDCLWAWLEKYPLIEGSPLVPRKGIYDKILYKIWRRAKIRKWPSNAFRHGFASYFYAATNRNLGLVMEIMGHTGSSALFHTRYKGKVTKAEGEDFCRILPTGIKNRG